MVDVEPDEIGSLVVRSGCPVCGRRTAPFLSIPFDGPPMVDYLDHFYCGRLDTAPLTGERYELAECDGCGLVYQLHVPDERYLDHLYGSAAFADPDAVRSTRGLAVRRAYAHDVEQFLKFFDTPAHDVHVLDFGSGTALWLDMAKAYGCRTTGSEMTEKGRERIRASGHRPLGPDALPERAFHFINTEQVVEHLTDPLGTVQMLATALRPGGLLRISVPNGSDIRARLELGDWSAPKGSPRSLNAVAPLEHVNCFDAGSLRRLGETSGLEPFHYPFRQYMDPMERVRFVASAVAHLLNRPNGTLQLFRKPSA